ncbi:PREDICTED: uncharacterized protein LOC108359029 [Rhagoletis zephyria]|uniref:uncharacterized protein LOC108359029 n=1 Tax=Rhagoletis zephyria TaxID=28612 RepID=UPI0008119F27|nr:PREDICTED: uncharacterized protein LOC108359029 [Rhagoletis zephyria]
MCTQQYDQGYVRDRVSRTRPSICRGRSGVEDGQANAGCHFKDQSSPGVCLGHTPFHASCVEISSNNYVAGYIAQFVFKVFELSPEDRDCVVWRQVAAHHSDLRHFNPDVAASYPAALCAMVGVSNPYRGRA